MDHLDRNHLLSNSQFGFRSGRSCVLQLLDFFLEDWPMLLEEKKSWDTLYLGRVKAFNKVSPQRLLR